MEPPSDNHDADGNGDDDEMSQSASSSQAEEPSLPGATRMMMSTDEPADDATSEQQSTSSTDKLRLAPGVATTPSSPSTPSSSTSPKSKLRLESASAPERTISPLAQSKTKSNNNEPSRPEHGNDDEIAEPPDPPGVDEYDCTSDSHDDDHYSTISDDSHDIEQQNEETLIQAEIAPDVESMVQQRLAEQQQIIYLNGATNNQHTPVIQLANTVREKGMLLPNRVYSLMGLGLVLLLVVTTIIVMVDSMTQTNQL